MASVASAPSSLSEPGLIPTTIALLEPSADVAGGGRCFDSGRGPEVAGVEPASPIPLSVGTGVSLA
jgi:hypothetical protein